MKSCTRKRVALLVIFVLVIFSFSANFCSSDWINSWSKRVVVGAETGASAGAQARAIMGAFEGANLAIELREEGLNAERLRRADRVIGLRRVDRAVGPRGEIAANLATLKEEQARLAGGGAGAVIGAGVGVVEGACIGAWVGFFEDNIKTAQERTEISLNGYYLGCAAGYLAGLALKSVTGSDHTAKFKLAGAVMGLVIGHRSYNSADPAH